MVAVDVSHTWLDEPGLCPLQAHVEIAKRTRCHKATIRQKLYTGTPEGVNWFGELVSNEDIVEEGHYNAGPEEMHLPRFSVADKLLILHGTTYDNPYSPEDYLRSLEKAFA